MILEEENEFNDEVVINGEPLIEVDEAEDDDQEEEGVAQQQLCNSDDEYETDIEIEGWLLNMFSVRKRDRVSNHFNIRGQTV